MPHEIERRVWLAQFRDVVEEEHATAESAAAPTIEGYAAIFDSESEDLGGFREVIKPGAFDRAIKDKADVRALLNHDPNHVLGRVKNGTLELGVDDTGLRAKITPPPTSTGRDVITSLKRGDLDGMSFAFRTITDAWHLQDEQPIRELLDLELVDVSIVAYPAYSATSVSARALQDARKASWSGVPTEINRQRLDLV